MNYEDKLSNLLNTTDDKLDALAASTDSKLQQNYSNINMLSGEELQAHQDYIKSLDIHTDPETGVQYQNVTNPDGTISKYAFNGSTRNLYEDSTLGGNKKAGLASTYNGGFQGRYTPNEETGYGWAPGPKGVTVDNGPDNEYVLPSNDVTAYEALINTNAGQIADRAAGIGQIDEYTKNQFGPGYSEYTTTNAPLYSGRETTQDDLSKALTPGTYVQDLTTQQAKNMAMFGSPVYTDPTKKYIKPSALTNQDFFEASQSYRPGQEQGYFSNLTDAAQSGVGTRLAKVGDAIADSVITKESSAWLNEKLGDDWVTKKGDFVGLDKYKLAKEYGYDDSRIQDYVTEFKQVMNDPKAAWYDKSLVALKGVIHAPEVLASSSGDILLAATGIPGMAALALSEGNEMLAEREKIKGELTAEDYAIVTPFAIAYAAVNKFTGGMAGLTPVKKVLGEAVKYLDKPALQRLVLKSRDLAKNSGIKGAEEGVEELLQGYAGQFGTKLNTAKQDEIFTKETLIEQGAEAALGFGGGAFTSTVSQGYNSVKDTAQQRQTPSTPDIPESNIVDASNVETNMPEFSQSFAEEIAGLQPEDQQTRLTNLNENINIARAAVRKAPDLTISGNATLENTANSLDATIKGLSAIDSYNIAHDTVGTEPNQRVNLEGERNSYIIKTGRNLRLLEQTLLDQGLDLEEASTRISQIVNTANITENTKKAILQEYVSDHKKFGAKPSTPNIPEETLIGLDQLPNMTDEELNAIAEANLPDINQIPKEEEESKTPVYDTLPGRSTIPTFTYAGVGSRQTPPEVLAMMEEISGILEKEEGYTLNTGLTYYGKSEGADAAFAKGVKDKSKVNLFTPEEQGRRKKEQQIANEIHQSKKSLTKKSGLELHSRNVNQVFGDKLDTPVDFVLAWTPLNDKGEVVTTAEQRYYGGKDNPKNTGGTGQAIALASMKGIPVINMADPKWRDQLNAVLKDVKERSNSVYNSTYEVSTKGDKRFSALVAKLKEGSTTEDTKSKTSQDETYTYGTSQRSIEALARTFGLSPKAVQDALADMDIDMKIRKMSNVSAEADRVQREVYIGDSEGKRPGIKQLITKYRAALEVSDKSAAIEAITKLQQLGFTQAKKLVEYKNKIDNAKDLGIEGKDLVDIEQIAAAIEESVQAIETELKRYGHRLQKTIEEDLFDSEENLQNKIETLTNDIEAAKKYAETIANKAKADRKAGLIDSKKALKRTNQAKKKIEDIKKAKAIKEEELKRIQKLMDEGNATRLVKDPADAEPLAKQTDKVISGQLGLEVGTKSKQKPSEAIMDINEADKHIERLKAIPDEVQEIAYQGAKKKAGIEEAASKAKAEYEDKFNNLSPEDKAMYKKLTNKIKKLMDALEKAKQDKKTSQADLRRIQALEKSLKSTLEKQGSEYTVDEVFAMVDEANGMVDEDKATTLLERARKILERIADKVKIAVNTVKAIVTNSKSVDEIKEEITNINEDIEAIKKELIDAIAARKTYSKELRFTAMAQEKFERLNERAKKVGKKTGNVITNLFKEKNQLIKTLKNGVQLKKDLAQSFVPSKDFKGKYIDFKKVGKVKGSFFSTLNLPMLTRIVQNKDGKAFLDIINNGVKTINKTVKMERKTSKAGNSYINEAALNESYGSTFAFNQKGELHKSVAMAIVYTAENYMTTSFSDLLYNDNEAIAKMLDKNSAFEVTPEERALLKKGRFPKVLSLRLGNDIFNILGYEFNTNEAQGEVLPAELVNKVKQDLGNMALIYMQEQGYIENLQDDSSSISATEWKNVTGQDIGEGAKVNLIKGIDSKKDQFVDNRIGAKEVSEILDIDDQNRNYHTKKPNTDSKVYRVQNSQFEAPETNQEVLRKLEQQDFQILVNDNNTGAVDLFIEAIKDKKFLDGYKETIGYKDADAMEGKYLPMLIDAQKAKNAEIEKDIETLKEVYTRIKEDKINNELYFNWFFSKNGRYMLDSTLLNPQTSKTLHRFLVIPSKSVDTTWDLSNAKDELYFFGGIAQGFGIAPDGTTKADLLEAGKKLAELSKEELISLIAKGKGKTSNGVKFEAEHPGHTFQAIAAILAYKESKGKPFKATMTSEFDAKTSGFAIKMMQIPLLGEELSDWMLKAAILIDEEIDRFSNDKGMNDIFAEKNFSDSYQKLALDVHTATKGDVEDSFGLWDAINQGSIDDKPVIQELVDSKGNVTSFGRNLFKYPFVMFQYASGMRSIKKYIGSDLSIKVLQGILDGAFDDNKGKALRKELNLVEDAKWESFKKDLKEKDLDAVKVVPIKTFKGENNKAKSAYKVQEVISKVFEDAYGDALETVMDEHFSDFTKANGTIIQVTQLLMQNFLNKLNTRMAAEEAKLGRGLGEEEYRNIVLELSDYFPSIKGPYSKSSKDGIAIFAQKVVDKTKTTYAPTQTKYVGKNNEFTSLKVQALAREFKEAAAAGAVLPIHWLDGGIISTVLGNNGVVGIHDAIVLGLTGQESEAIVRDMNKAVYEINRDYSLVDEVVEALHRSFANDKEALKSLTNINAKGKEVLPAQVIADLIDLHTQVTEGRKVLFAKQMIVGNIIGYKGSEYIARPSGKDGTYGNKDLDLSEILNDAPGEVAGIAYAGSNTNDAIISTERASESSLDDVICG